MISRQSVDQVIHSAVIEEVVGEFITLKKRGANLVGLCPFHDERTPSFNVSPTRGIFNCFGCGKKGNAVGFLMEHNQMSFPDAIRYLAKKYGIELVETKEQYNEEDDKEAKKRESIFLALQFAQSYFTEQLNQTEEGRIAGKEYFKERGFAENTIVSFGLGYAKESWDGLAKAAAEAGFNLEYFELAGLIKKNEKGGYFDVFRNRAMFSIQDVAGRVIAFAGRQLKKDEKSPKYVNSPETEVYHKSSVLYALFQAKKEIKKQDNCFLVEGYTDVITLHQSGFENVVASSGTALTEGQIKLLRRFTPNVTVLYDGDKAGINASLRGVDLLLEHGLNVKVVTFPDGEDPDSFCRKEGPELFGKYLAEHTRDFVLFKTDLLYEEAKNDPIKRTQVIQSVLESIAKIPDSLKRSVYIQECSKIVDIPSEELMLQVKRILQKANKDEVKRVDREIQQLIETGELATFQYKPEASQEKALIRVLLLYGNKPFTEEKTVFEFVNEELNADESLKFSNNVVHAMLQEVRKLNEEKSPWSVDTFTQHTNNEFVMLAVDFSTEKYQLSSHWHNNEIFVTGESENYIAEVESVLLYLKLRKVDELLKAESDLLKDVSNEELIETVLWRISALLETKKKISEFLGTVVY